MSDEKFIIVPLYCRVGLCNQWISLQLATVLAHLTKRTLILDLDFGFLHSSDSHKEMFAHIGRAQPSDLQITDLYDLPIPMLEYRKTSELKQFINNNSHNIHIIESWPTCFLNSVIQVDERIDTKYQNEFQAFCHKRKTILKLNTLLHRNERIIRLRRAIPGKDPASFYFSQPISLFYTSNKAIRSDIARISASIRPKPIYLNIARGIALNIKKQFKSTDFYAIHLRRGDKVAINPYIRNLKSDWLIKHIHQVFQKKKTTTNNIPLVISTCTPTDPIINDLKKHFTNLILIDDYINQNCQNILNTLEFGKHDVVHAFISLLTCTYAKQFMGTQGSTFTSYIHHIRGVQGIDTHLEYCYPKMGNHNTTDRWSWQRRGTESYCTGWFVVHPEDWEHFTPNNNINYSNCNSNSDVQLYPNVKSKSLDNLII